MLVSLGGSAVKKPPAMQETWVGSLGWEDPLEEGTATQSSILAWRIICTEEPGGLQSVGSRRVWRLSAQTWAGIPGVSCLAVALFQSLLSSPMTFSPCVAASLISL